MRKISLFSAVILVSLLVSNVVFAQGITIRGNVQSSVKHEGVPFVTILVKGTGQGVFTESNGNFSITVAHLPVVLIFSSVGFETQEVTVSDASKRITVNFVNASTLGQEVVIAATRTPMRILESPVSIERISLANIRNSASPDYYEGIKNVKGVDLTISSIDFKTASTRGFNGSGNLRFNQLVDGMDNAAPSLNFSVGNIVGPTELDIENIEILQGASSALYGSSGTNGTMLMTTKNPFKYQGFSFQVKQGVNHVNDRNRLAAPYYDWSFRWAKAIKGKWAFKLTGQMKHAQDWEASDDRDLLRNNVISSLKEGNRTTDPNYDGVNVYGDEASASMEALSQAVRAQLIAGGGAPVTGAVDAYLSGGATYSQIVAAFNANPSLAPYSPYLPYLVPTSTVSGNPYKNTYTGAAGGSLVSRTGYNEKDLVDYNAYNVKFSGAIHYKITNAIEASLNGNWGTGTSVYTGADRYSLKNFILGQYKAEVKASNWFLRAYTTQGNSGDSYTAITAALFINNLWKPNSTWFQTYTAVYGSSRLEGGMSDADAHANARAAADMGRFLPGTADFNNAFKQATSTSINAGGSKFADRTNLYHAEGQYNFKNEIKIMDMLVGASYRVYHLNSHGTIFTDTAAPININEAGAYLQLQKSLLRDILKLTGTIRYDKQGNFTGRATPRATALIRVAKNNNIRISYQTAYRFPSANDQYINILTGGANRLIGGLPEFNTYFGFDANPAYTSQSIEAYRNSIAAGTPNPALLQKAQFQNIKPERANSYEIGFRGLTTPRLLIDAYAYYCVYKDFIGRVAVGRGASGNPNNAATDLASPFTTNNISFVVNASNFGKVYGANTISTDEIKAIGWGISANYLFHQGYEMSANVSSDQLTDVPAGIITSFNTPKYRTNLGFGNKDVYRGIGFNAQWRWQDKMAWEGTFGTGDVPAFSTIDAQVSYQFKKIHSLVKLGGSNILNHYYTSAFGNPLIGALYYASFAYNFQ
jgi:TonB-dependent SusC/RagA subfamily outer membrane receptor